MLKSSSWLAAALTLCLDARAEQTQPTPLELDASSGVGWIDGEHSEGPAGSLSGSVRYHVLSVGLAVRGSTILLQSNGSVSALGGITLPLGVIRLDALGELGLNAYANVGSTLLTGDPGADGILPFAGVRFATAARVLRSPEVELWLGPMLTYSKDLSEATRQYTFVSQAASWFGSSDQGDEIATEVTLGQSAWALFATMTASFRIPPP